MREQNRLFRIRLPSGYHQVTIERQNWSGHSVSGTQMCVCSLAIRIAWYGIGYSDTVYLTICLAMLTRAWTGSYHKHIKIKLKGIKFWKVKISSSKIGPASVPCRNNLIAGHSALIRRWSPNEWRPAMQNFGRSGVRDLNFTVINAQSIVLKEKGR